MDQLRSFALLRMTTNAHVRDGCTSERLRVGRSVLRPYKRIGEGDSPIVRAAR